MKNKSKLTRRCNQIIFSFIALVLITFSSLLQASPLSKEEQAHIIIVTSPTAQKLQKLADDIGTDIYFYVEGLTGNISTKNILYVPALLSVNNGTIVGTASIPRLSILLDTSGKTLQVLGEGGVRLSEEIITELNETRYLSLWDVKYDIDSLYLSEFSNLEGLRVINNDLILINLPINGVLKKIEIQDFKLKDINNFEWQDKLKSLRLEAINSIGYKKLENNSSLEKLELWMGKDSIDVSKIVNLKSLAIFNVEYDSIKNVVHLDNIKSLTFWWAKDERISTIYLPKSIEVFAMIVSSREAIMPLVNLPKLKKVIINSDTIKGLPKFESIPTLENLPQLETLEISDSKLTSLDGIEKLTSLKYVRFENNEITDISALFPLENLIKVDLSQNKITELGDLGKKPNLNVVRLNFNPIEAFDFEMVSNYPYCAFTITGTPFIRNAPKEDKLKLKNLWQKGHL
ncbi:leucine-rich repeat domain-containing protein [Aliivibrio wodanis]|uniref:leucine-rich repeat domain-containing protein n=1 Tax=Aliivibrio wodanis TaxID=80852 RepID=UPI00406BFC06